MAGAIARQVIQQIAEVDVGRVAERNDMRESHASACRPVDDSGDQCTRLRQERDIAGHRRDMREARIEPDARKHQPETVGTLNAQAHPLPRAQHLIAQFSPDACRDHDRGAGARFRQIADYAGNHLRRCNDDAEIHRLRQRVD
jgi:hypothetical protein